MLKQSLNFKLLQKLSPQQIQLMKLIQLPTQAFEERLKQEIEENPALDTGKEEPEDFEDSLENEYEDDGNEKIDTEDINIDEYLSDDEVPNYKTQTNNYAADDDIKLVDDLAFTQNIFTTEEKVLELLINVVQKLDPIGVGARDLKECLIIQLKTKSTQKIRTLASNLIHHL